MSSIQGIYTSYIKQMPRISVCMFSITSICHLILSRHLSFSVGSEPTALGQFFSESDIFGLAKWLALAPNGLCLAGACVLVGSPAHARLNGLQAILLAWQAIRPAWHKPKNESGLHVLHFIWAPSVLFFVVVYLPQIPRPPIFGSFQLCRQLLSPLRPIV
jgi:hypothetical protein